MITQTYAQWVQEGENRFGLDRRAWPVVCPKCGHIQTPKDFHALHLEPENALLECIGRHVEGKGCSWAAYGLFGTAGKGRNIMFPDRKELVEIFDFAPPHPEEDAPNDIQQDGHPERHHGDHPAV